MAIGAIAAGAGAWVWGKYGEAITDAAVGAIKEKWAQFKWNDAAACYRDKTLKLYGTLRVLGSLKPVSLEGVFTDLFVLDRPTAFRRFDIARLQEDPSTLEAKDKRISGLRLVTQPEAHRLFILGKPGAGKTTFLKYITLQAVKGKLDKIPVLVSLREWTDSGLELLPFVTRQFEICGFPDAQRFIEEVLKAGESIILFDGLDEIRQESDQRAQSIQALSDFSKQYHLSQCLITCRTAATEYTFERFMYVEIADFTDEQMRVYAHKWFGDNHVKRDKFLKELTKEEHRGLQELGRTPLLLSLLCLAFNETMAFPRRRVEVYEEALDALLKKWDATRNIQRDEVYRKLSLGRKRQMLARIAAETFEQEMHFIRQDTLEARIVDYLRKLPPADADEDVDGGAVLKAIEAQHGILVERARRIYSFSHLTFQEYFTAKYIVDNAASGTLERSVHGHLTDHRWREVFLQVASLLDCADQLCAVFREAIQRLIGDDETLIRILQWAHKQAATADVELRPVVIRGLYLSLPLACSVAPLLQRVRERERAVEGARSLSLVRSPWRVEVAERARERDRIRALERGLAQAIASARVPTTTLGFALALTRDLEQELHRFSGDAVVLDPAMDIALDLAVEFGRVLQLGDVTLVFKRHLDRILALRKDIGCKWRLSDQQLVRVLIYLNANRLLIECLDLAYVSDRVQIEESLLLPPEM